MSDLLVFVLVLFAFALLARRLSRWTVTGPMVFATAGLVLSDHGLGLLQLDLSHHAVLALAELTLAVVLFSDAARIDPFAVRHSPQIPARLLAVAMPLTIVAGIAVGALLLSDTLGFWEAAVLAAVLAPTDAALGHAVVSNQAIPGRIRQGLNVESGLNDGLSVPFLFLFVALSMAMDSPEGAGPVGHWMRFAAEQIGIGTVAGLVVGGVGAMAVKAAVDRGLPSSISEQFAAIALALVAYVGAEHLGGNGFIAAFVAGMAGGAVAPVLRGRLLAYTEDSAVLLSVATFFVFGALAGPHLTSLTWQVALYAVCSLTLVRMLPVALSMLGLGLSPVTVLFLGWFGPRGLASVVLALVVLSHEHLAGSEGIFEVMVATVFLSIFAHGLTARPLGDAYARHCARVAQAESPEMAAVQPLRVRNVSHKHNLPM